MSYRASLALLLLSAAASPAAADPTLALPIDCTLGETCHLQNFVDIDPSDRAEDFTCGFLTYDGHKGTDFALPSLAAMQAGVNVLAAAPGVVRATRDEMPDILMTNDNAAAVDGRECGNGVVIRHADGWETQYCHMKRGSIAVTSGQRVETGTVLGQVGLSGRTQFPHVHLSVRQGNKVVDPFAPDAEAGTCGTAPSRTLWSDPPAYRAGGLSSAGFATAVPAFDAIKQGDAALAEIDTRAPAIVLWAFGFGARPDDQMALRIFGPDGEVFAHTDVLESRHAQFFRAGGKRLRSPLPPGRYSGEVTMIRGGTALDTLLTEVEVR